MFNPHQYWLGVCSLVFPHIYVNNIHVGHIIFLHQGPFPMVMGLDAVDHQVLQIQSPTASPSVHTN